MASGLGVSRCRYERPTRGVPELTARTTVAGQRRRHRTTPTTDDRRRVGSDGADSRRPSAEEILEEDFEAELELAAEAEGSTGNGGAKRPNVLLRLYRGETSFDFIGNRRWWFGISSAHHPHLDHLSLHPGPQPEHRLQGRPVVAGHDPDPDRAAGHGRGQSAGVASPRSCS